jgi:isopentenyl-diphosphate delta-isomerase
MEKVILVDEHDNELGSMEKMEAHRAGALHRAFSVILFNSKGEMLLQKRSANKYHSAGLWTNTCCSHPKPSERMEVAVRRRLKEEMGIDTQPVYAYKFMYRVALDNKLIEHEMDYVYMGLFDAEPVINTSEVENWRFMNLTEIRKEISENPESFTHWFRLIVDHPELEIFMPA